MLILENTHIQVIIRPERGARIDQITHKQRGKDWLWHPTQSVDDVSPVDLGSHFDSHWQGGWDDIFPSDAPGEWQGHELFDHGELWSREWQVLSGNSHTAHLSRMCESYPVRVEKSVYMDGSNPKFRVEYRLINVSGTELPYLFKLHPALAIEEGDEFILPSCEVEPVDLGFSTRIGVSDPTLYPNALGKRGEVIDLSRALAPGPHREFFYGTLRDEGPCALLNARTGARIAFHFSTKAFPCVWVFQSYGGFHGHYVAMLEPCTNKPYDLMTALEQGTCARLAPWSTAEYAVDVVLE